MKGKGLKIAGYAAAGLLLLVIFLYARFPGDAFRDYLIAKCEGGYPGTALSLKSVKPALPIGIAVTKAELRFHDNPDSTLMTDEMTVKLSLLSLLQGRTSFSFQGTGYDGVMNGRITFPRALSTAGTMKVEMNCNDMTAQKVSALHGLLGRKITGKLRAALTFTGRPEKLIDGSGRLKFTALNGSYPLRETVAGINKINFTAGEGDVTLSEHLLKIGRLNLTGDKVNCSLSGSISVNAEDFKESTLEMTGSFAIRGLQRKIPISVNGTFNNPVMNLM